MNEMVTEYKAEYDRLFTMLSQALKSETPQSDQENTETDGIGQDADRDWAAIVEIAAKHGVISLLYEELRRQKNFPQELLKRAEGLAQTVVRQNYRLLYLSWQIQQAMCAEGIRTVLLKGAGTASYYAVPELRKSGDIDLLLLDLQDAQKAARCLEKLGFQQKEWQPSLHHIVYSLPTERGRTQIEAELHTMFAEPFDDERVNALLEEQVPLLEKHSQTVTVSGLPLVIPDQAYHAYELLLHMLQHFLRSGFGLKLLCDWVVLWNRETDAPVQEEYLRLVRECGIKRFSDLISLVCVRYLGLPAERIAFMDPDTGLSCEDFMAEVLQAEEFGKTAKDRMVALRGNGIWDYIREFHHQMRLNYPKAGKWIVLWPVLWAITLVRFCRNNRLIRKVSLFSVLKTAGTRGKLVNNLQLFRQER